MLRRTITSAARQLFIQFLKNLRTAGTAALRSSHIDQRISELAIGRSTAAALSLAT
jgi:hypothetical protein